MHTFLQYLSSRLRWTSQLFVLLLSCVTLYACVKEEKFQICVSSLLWWTSVEVTCASGVFACRRPCVLVSFGVHNALAGGTSVFECLCKCMALCIRVCLCCLPAGQAAVGTGYIGQDGVSVCRVLSSLYSNGRLCCFTCCGGWSGV